MARKERNYDTILKNLEGMKKAIENLDTNAKRLKVEAEAAESVLKDRVGKKDTDMIKSVADTIIKAVKPGVERIRELERKIKSDKSRFEELER